ncbi:MAG: pyridoxal-phosphate dependent enzyme [Candidatus Margulisbacteria bacterium]|jgi:tryptophan synthase beta chain|nr:pyridoxal-phosphate dependent enzyme [Candidatus Margulisiibacteriota bacterium]
MAGPDPSGRYGKFGGRFVSELSATFLDELKAEYDRLKKDADFSRQLNELLSDYLGQPTPLFFARRFAEYLKGGKIYLKREDLNYTGSAAALNVLGQALLAKQLGRREIIVESAGGEQAWAAASLARHFGLRARIYTSQPLPLLAQAQLRSNGAEVIIKADYQYKDLVNVCVQDWLAEPLERYYIPALPVGPHPLPEITRDLQSFIGLELARAVQRKEQRPPDILAADSALALGAFYPFIKTEAELIVVEPVETIEDLAPLADGQPAVFQGAYTRVLQYANGQAGVYASPCPELNYPAVPPELAYLHATGRLTLSKIPRQELLAAADLFRETEGLNVSLRSAAVLAELIRRAPTAGRAKILTGVLASADLELWP